MKKKLKPFDDWAKKLADRLADGCDLSPNQAAQAFRICKIAGYQECVDWLENTVRGMKGEIARIEHGESGHG